MPDLGATAMTVDDDGGAARLLDKRTANTVLVALTLISFLIIGGTLASLGVYLPSFQQSFQLADDAAGGVITAFLVAMSLTSIVAGWALERLGPRAILAIGIAMTTTGWAATSLAGTPTELALALGLTGAGVGMATVVPGVALITHWFDAHRAMAMAIFFSGYILASAFVPIATEFMIERIGWSRTALAASIVIGLACTGLIPLVRMARAAGADTGSATQAGRAQTGLDGLDVAAALATPSFWILTLALLLTQLSINSVLYTLVTYLIGGGFSPSKAVLIYGCSNLCGLPGLFLGGALVDSKGSHKVLPIGILLIAIGTGALFFALHGGVIAVAAIALFMLTWGLAGGIPAQIGPLLMVDLIGQKAFAKLLGISLAIVGIVGSVAPLITGWLVSLGGYPLSYGIAAISALIAAILVGTLHKTKR